MAEQWEKELGNRLWNAKKQEDVKWIIEECKKRYRAKPIALGHENNIGPINFASDPGLALIERITNGIDSLIDLKVHLENPMPLPLSPEEAVNNLFNIPKGGDGDLTDTEVRELSENLVIEMHEADTKRLTVRVTDQGTGQHPADFERTLLSLNKSNKADLPYVAGIFGQGGSATLSFSDHTIYCSRRHPSLLKHGESDRIGFTVAYQEDFDPDATKYPPYVWLVKENGMTLDLPVEAVPDFEHGTRINHIGYDSHRLSGFFSVWQFLNGALFEPVLPFKFVHTNKKGRTEDRVIRGNARRLTRPEDTARGDLIIHTAAPHQISLGKDIGSVEASWWVITRPEESSAKKNPAESYVNANNAVSMTLHGQRQATKDRRWLKSRTNLDYLSPYMIVNINANGLTARGRLEMFSSTRERARESVLHDNILTEVVDLIRDDGDLKHLNDAARDRALRSSTNAADKKVQKHLGKLIKTKRESEFKPGQTGSDPSSGDGNGGRGTQPGDKPGKKPRKPHRPTKPRDITDKHFGNVPTSIAFESKKLRVRQGFATTIWVLIDAKNNYLPNHDSELKIKFSGPEGKHPAVKSRQALQGGKSMWKIQCPSDAPLGDYEMSVSLMTANGFLSASIPLVVSAPTEPKRGGKGGRKEETGPEIKWVDKKEDGTWVSITDKEFDDSVVGLVTADDKTIIYVNRDFAPLSKMLKSQCTSQRQIDNRCNRYLLPIAWGLWHQHYEVEQAGINDSETPPEKYQENELARLAEAIIIAIEPEMSVIDKED